MRSIFVAAAFAAMLLVQPSCAQENQVHQLTEFSGLLCTSPEKAENVFVNAQNKNLAQSITAFEQINDESPGHPSCLMLKPAPMVFNVTVLKDIIANGMIFHLVKLDLASIVFAGIPGPLVISGEGKQSFYSVFPTGTKAQNL